MKIVIDISEKDYEKVQHGRAPVIVMRNAIRNGILLPKGHGRLIDADALNEAYTYECISECDRCEHCSKDGHECELLLNAPTIVEEDTVESEDE